MTHCCRSGAFRLLLVAALGAGISCGNRGMSGPEDAPIALHGEIDRDAIAPGGMATLTFRLENISPEPITLHFNTGCQIMPYVAAADTGEIVHPEGGTWFCTQALTTLELPAHGVETRQLQVAGGDAPPGGVVLPPGRYVAHARLEDTVHRLVSTSIPFTVQ